MAASLLNSLLKELIHFEEPSASAVYIQISQQLINAIQHCYLSLQETLWHLECKLMREKQKKPFFKQKSEQTLKKINENVQKICNNRLIKVS